MTYAKLMKVTFVAVLLSGCGHTAPPSDKLAASTAALRAAQLVGAQADPQASLALKLAQDEIDQAGALMANGDHERARTMLERANADAELAIALTRESIERKQTETALRQAQAAGVEPQGGPTQMQPMGQPQMQPPVGQPQMQPPIIVEPQTPPNMKPRTQPVQ